MSSFDQTKISLCFINYCSNSWWNQSVFACVHWSRLCHKLWTLHHPRQLGQQLAAAKLCHHWHRKLPVLHQSVLLLPVSSKCVKVWWRRRTPSISVSSAGSWSSSSPRGVSFCGPERSCFRFCSTPCLCFTGWVWTVSSFGDTEFTPRTVWLSPP